MTINILGQDYDFQEIAAKEDMRMADMNGYCDPYSKVIRVDNDFNENHPSSISDFKAFKEKVIRHEIIHAFFAEAGMREYTENELLVGWIATQFPKMLKVFHQVGAL